MRLYLLYAHTMASGEQRSSKADSHALAHAVTFSLIPQQTMSGAGKGLHWAADQGLPPKRAGKGRDCIVYKPHF